MEIGLMSLHRVIFSVVNVLKSCFLSYKLIRILKVIFSIDYNLDVFL